MPDRKPTVDGVDDIDDEDGAVEEEISEENDLTLTVETLEEASDELDQDEMVDEEEV